MFSDSAGRLAGIAAVWLGWRPDEFWRATPTELAVVFAALAGDGAAPLTRDELVRLEERFPDG